VTIDCHTMTIQDVAAFVGVSTERIRQLDEILAPARRANGYRRYDPRVVQAFVAERDAKKAESA
jgi:DNA-binding transcriptional MerR regulator